MVLAPQARHNQRWRLFLPLQILPDLHIREDLHLGHFRIDIVTQYTIQGIDCQYPPTTYFYSLVSYGIDKRMKMCYGGVVSNRYTPGQTRATNQRATSRGGITTMPQATQATQGPTAYCMRCKTKREMKNPEKITMTNGKPATQGICPVCGTKMFRIGG